MESAGDSPPSRTPGDWSSPGRFAFVLALMIFIPFWDILLGINTFAVRDFGLFSYPVADFYRQCFWKGELPFWDPLSCCGVPFMAQFNTLVLYPLSLIYLLFPLTWSLPFFCLSHLFLGGMGAYFLARRWTGSRAGACVAGVVFAFNGLSLNFLMWPSHTATFAWIPWVIFLTERAWQRGGRAIVPAALAAAMEILGGGPESILFTWLILLALGMVECAKGSVKAGAWARRFFLTGMLAAGFAAAQILPFADFALHCNRSSHYAASEWSMPPWGWANFLAPVFQTWRWLGMSEQLDQYWTSSYYVGIGTILLAALAVCRVKEWRVRVIAGFVLASMVIALGDHGFVYRWLREALPFLGFFRYPIKFVIITSALFPLLAAYAVSQYENYNKAPRSWKAEWVGAAIMAILMAILMWFARFRPVLSSSFPDTLMNALERLACLGALLGAIYFFAAQPEKRRWSVLLILAVCWIDLLTGIPWQNPTLDNSVYQPGLGLMTAKLNPVPQLDDSRVMMSPASAQQIYNHPAKSVRMTYLLDRAVFLSNCNLLDGVPKVDGFFSLYLRESAGVLAEAGQAKGAKLEHLEDFLGVSQTIESGKLYDWVARTNYLPVVSVGRSPVFASDAEALSATEDTNVDFRRTVYLPPDAKTQITAKAEPSAKVLEKHFAENKNTVVVESPKPAMLCISQSYYHNWKAAVDGKPVPLWRANFAFQAVEVPAGRHEVTLVYKDNLFLIGTILMIASALCCAALWRMDPVDGKLPNA